MSGAEVLPLVEGGKGISATNGQSSGAWAACGGIGTFSGVNADFYDVQGDVVPQVYRGRTRKDRHEELVDYAIRGGVTQARIAHETANGLGRIHMNILWEMGAAQRVLQGVLEGARGLVHGVTCGAGMPYRLAEIAASYGVYYYPIVSSGRAFRALWKRAYHKFSEFLGAVVYEDPWRAGGHNGLSNSEDPLKPEPPYPRVVALRRQMHEFGLDRVPIVMAGGIWFLREWEDWIDNPELGPVSFQFGTRALLTKESPIPDAWKRRLLSLKEGDVLLNRFSPTGFWSSAVRNEFIDELEQRNARQIAFTEEPVGEHDVPFPTGARKREVYVTEADRKAAEGWIAEGYVEALVHVDLRDGRQDEPDSQGSERMHGVPQSMPLLELGGERKPFHRPQGGPPQLLYPEDVAGRRAFRAYRHEPDVRGSRGPSIRQGSVLRRRFRAHRAPAFRADRHRRLSAGRRRRRSAVRRDSGKRAPRRTTVFVFVPSFRIMDGDPVGWVACSG